LLCVVVVVLCCVVLFCFVLCCIVYLFANLYASLIVCLFDCLLVGLVVLSVCLVSLGPKKHKRIFNASSGQEMHLFRIGQKNWHEESTKPKRSSQAKQPLDAGGWKRHEL
jgi:hypothetical protein